MVEIRKFEWTFRGVFGQIKLGSGASFTDVCLQYIGDSSGFLQGVWHGFSRAWP